jgi:hypothetical protein
MLEAICMDEDEMEERKIEEYLRRLKAGSDIENAYVMGYLKNENAI